MIDPPPIVDDPPPSVDPEEWAHVLHGSVVLAHCLLGGALVLLLLWAVSRCIVRRTLKEIVAPAVE